MRPLTLLVAIVPLMVVAISISVAGGTSSPAAPSTTTIGLIDQSMVPNVIEEDEDLIHVRKNSPQARLKLNAMGRSTAKPTARVQPVSPTSPFAPGLSGTYTIPGDFTSISSAVAILNSVGVVGNVTFLLGSSTYTEPSAVTFTSYPGVDSFSVTMQPAPATNVTINFQPGLSEGKGFAFVGAGNVTIDGLNSGGSGLTMRYSGGTFPTGDAFAATIYVTAGSKNISVKNASIEGQVNGSWAAQTESRAAVFCWKGSEIVRNTNITIDHCTISNASFGLKILSNPIDRQGPVSFTNNNVGDAFGEPVAQGALTDACSGLNFSNNLIDGIEFVPYYWQNGTTEYDTLASFGALYSFFWDFGQPGGGHFFDVDSNTTVAYNTINNIHQAYDDSTFSFIIYGLSIRGTSVVASVHDNRITGVHTTDANGTDVGLRSQVRAFHNSVRLTGTQTANQSSYCLRATGGDFFNNALSNERTGAAGSKIRVLSATPTGNSNGNAFYSTSGQITTASTLAGYFATGKDANSLFGPVNFTSDMHLDPAGPSAAENIGLPSVLLANDIDGNARDTTASGMRDAGADEVATALTSVQPVDVFPTVISSPPSSGGIIGNYIPVVQVKNNSNLTTTAFNVNLMISGGYNQTVSINLGKRETRSVSFPTWSTASSGMYTITATTLLNDAVAANDTLSRSQQIIIGDPVTDRLFTWNGSNEGWTASGPDFVRSFSFSKLGGPFSGASWVTRTSGNYTSSATNTLTSPSYNLTTIVGDGNIYISFYESIDTEPSRDRSMIQYSTDGTTWKQLGVLNDPEGINWYNECVYHNANPSSCSTSMESGTSTQFLGATPPAPGWTSNGNCAGPDTSEGPYGYVYHRLRITPSTYPDIIGATAIQFRYVTTADAAVSSNGWAIDNFRIGGTDVSMCNDSVNGQVYVDLNRDGTRNGLEIALAGVPVELRYYDCHVAYDTTDANGAYSFILPIVGTYSIKIHPSWGASQPSAGSYVIRDSGFCRSSSQRDFGVCVDSVKGSVYDDLNNNGSRNNGEGGIAGIPVELRSIGNLVAFDTTDANGDYVFALNMVGPYTISVVTQLVVTQPSGSIYTLIDSGTCSNYFQRDFGLYLDSSTVQWTVNYNLSDQWNMVSVPLVVDNYSRSTLYPGSVSEAFAYQGLYVVKDTLKNGVGYWLKFSLNQTVAIRGYFRTRDTLPVSPGWNMIGSLSSPVAVVNITSNPPGLITSRFFGFDGFYSIVDTLHPGKGYWTKVNQAGSIILSTTASPAQQNRIRIVSVPDAPPPPPDAPVSLTPPVEYGLEQNYPNPFNPLTEFRFSIPELQFVSLKIYDVIGREVVALVGEELSPGVYRKTWDASGVASGMYYYRMITPEYGETRKLILVR